MPLKVKRIPTKKDFFMLAQILAILSGTWIVGAGVFMNFALTNTILLQNQVGVIIDITHTNNTNLTTELVSSAEGLVTNIDSSLNIFLTIFMLAIIFAIFSILCWIVGLMRDDIYYRRQ